MCKSCWTTEYEASSILNDNVTKAVELIEAIYDKQSSCTGIIHVILEDWNLECFDGVDLGGMTLEERECYEHMAYLTVAERASALARYEKFI